MRRFLLCFLVVILSAVGSLFADETVRAAQSRLKADKYYSGAINGNYDSHTAAAVTRYQIRNGLQINGNLDAPTRQALGVAASASAVENPLPKIGEEVWLYLRKSDQKYYIKGPMAEDSSAQKRSQSPASTVAPPSRTLLANDDRERLRDYVAAFVLAGLDPEVGSETEFFADRVDYFGERDVTRKRIRRDLQRYDSRWPERRFWLAGDLEITPINDQLKVSFPLRYDLRSGSKRSSGKVWKTLILEGTDTDDFVIVAVNERKAR